MRPNKIDTVETTFANNLIDSNGTQHFLINKINFGDSIFIKQIRPKFNTYYYDKITTKTAICLHFTVGNIKGDIGSLTKDGQKVSVNYVVDRQGNIYNLFDDKYWSYHLGSGTIGTNSVMSKQTIGIEISNYGPLKLATTGDLLDAYGNVYCNLREKEYYKVSNYRGYAYYATMTEQQEKSVAKLIKYLCKENNIPEIFKENPDEVFKTADEAKSFTGIYYHTSVRKDKFDWPDKLMIGVKDQLKKTKKSVEPPKVCRDPAYNFVPVEKPKVTTQSQQNKSSFFDTIIKFFGSFFKK